jgi:hypothetical protein
MKRCCFAALLLTFLAAPSGAQPANAGVYAIWYNNHPEVLKLPYIKGGQAAVQWGELDRSFTPLDEALAQAAATGLKTLTVQANGNSKPPALFDQVPSVPNWGDVQVRDPRGVLMYWHPVFIAAYAGFIRSFADHLYPAPTAISILGVRQNFDAVGTEHAVVPQFREAAKWNVPPGAKNGPDWTPAIEDAYKKTVIDAYIQAFVTGRAHPLTIFVRNNLPESIRNSEVPGGSGARYADYFRTGKLAWFQTGSEIEPRKGGAKAYETFLAYCRTGQTVGYAEPWADAWGEHAGKVDPRWSSPPQWNYWRVLSDLNMGITYVALYGNDLTVAASGKHDGASVGSDYQAEFNRAFEFAAKYAGYAAYPAKAPGAWIAFRQSQSQFAQSDYATRVTDYSMHLTLENPLDTIALDARKDGDDVPVVTNRTIAGLKSLGPYQQRYGAWARKLKAGSVMRLRLDPGFVDHANAGHPAIRVTYLDIGKGAFTLDCGGPLRETALTGSGEWKTAVIPVTSRLTSELRLRAVSPDGIVLHMVEVTR